MTVGQGELFVPPAKRRVARWHGFGWAGVDPSTKRCAIATIGPDGMRRVETVSFPSLTGAVRLAAIHDAVRGLWTSIGVDAGVVVVEQPSGTHNNLELVYAVGATLAAIGGVDCMLRPVIETVAGPKWKKEVCGHGGIRKPKPSSAEEYAVLGWARQAGYGGGSWDEADAWAIAEYARRTFLIERR